MSLGFGPPYPAADREYIRDLKEKHCYVTLDYDTEMSKNAVPSQQKKVQLPDGREVSLEQEALTCSEALFNTSLIGESGIGGSGPVDTLTECRGKKGVGRVVADTLLQERCFLLESFPGPGCHSLSCLLSFCHCADPSTTPRGIA